MDGNIKILAIESSCDETAASVSVDGRILSNIISSQIDIHRLYGGVVPEIASRNHLLNITGCVDEALRESGICMDELDLVAVTNGPGLVGALLVGVSYAKALSYSLGCRFMGVNHMHSHISACFLAGAEPPFIALVVSGGHTMLVRVDGYTEFTLLGTTKDDAAGEAFDKVARVMGLEYPGGAKLDILAEKGDPYAVEFPRAMLREDNCDFSFSGLKSAVLSHLNTLKMKGTDYSREDICASFRRCVVDILTEKTVRAAKEQGIKAISVCGGVACNSLLRSELKRRAAEEGMDFFVPEKIYCSDNAAMVACAAYHKYLKGDFSGLELNAFPALGL